MPHCLPEQVELLSLDVDGVLTDGGLYVDDQGQPLKKFHVADGLGIKLAQQAGLHMVVLTGKTSGVVAARCRELGITHFIQGSRDKAADLCELAGRLGIDPGRCAHLGDDLIDLPAFRVVGYPMAVANAAAEVRARAVWTTTRRGGDAAAREAIEHLLKARGAWDGIVAGFVEG